MARNTSSATAGGTAPEPAREGVWDAPVPLEEAYPTSPERPLSEALTDAQKAHLREHGLYEGD